MGTRTSAIVLWIQSSAGKVICPSVDVQAAASIVAKTCCLGRSLHRLDSSNWVAGSACHPVPNTKMVNPGLKSAVVALLLFFWNMGTLSIFLNVEPKLKRWYQQPSWEDVFNNNSAVPLNCSRIVATDLVPNTSIADECLPWCHESLGPRSHLELFLLSPGSVYFLGWSYVMDPSISSVIFMCLKVETASWGLWLLPSPVYAYMASFAYGCVSFVWLIYFWKITPKQHCSLGPKQDSIQKDGPFSSGHCKAPFCCISVGSDREASEWSLGLSAVCQSLEPTLDALSIITFVRCGQPFYAAAALTGVAFAIVELMDPFQICGAKAMAQSLAQGFATKGLHELKAAEFIETFLVTMVQCFALLRASSAESADTKTSMVLNLAVGASLSLFVSMPDQGKSWRLIEKVGHWRVQDFYAPNLQDFYDVERRTAQMSMGQKYEGSITCIMLATLFFSFTGREMAKPDSSEPDTGPVLDHLILVTFSLAFYTTCILFFAIPLCHIAFVKFHECLRCVLGNLQDCCSSCCCPSVYLPVQRESQLIRDNA